MDGSEMAKRRMRVILETVAGNKTVDQACAELGMGPAAFYKLRDRTMQDAVRSLEPRPVGRPKKTEPAEAQTIQALRDEVFRLKFELQASRLREEIAVVMPHLLVKKGPGAGPGDEKKGSRADRRRREKELRRRR
jgi:hypothetical protein